MSQDKFHAWIGYDKSAAQGNLIEGEYTPKRWEETDVDIEITHCGVCGSDIHTLSGGWGSDKYPYVVGHEIVGRAIKVGSQVKHIQVGDRVGVGAQSDSCGKPDCEFCSTNNETYCPGFVQTHDSYHKNGDQSQGGYGDNTRVPGAFVINLEPYPNIPSELLAPMLCGGVTTFSPLRKYGAGPGKKVAIIGLGGLGHYGIMFAKALGAEVAAVTRNRKKEGDALDLGADYVIATSDKDWDTANSGKFDLVINTVDSPKMPLSEYLGLVKHFGHFVQLGAPEGDMPGFSPFLFFKRNINFTGSFIGSRKEIQEMLALANEKGIKTWANPYSLSQVNDAIKAFNRAEQRYRIVLINEKNVNK